MDSGTVFARLFLKKSHMKPIFLLLLFLLPLPQLFSQSVLLLNTESEKIFAPVLPAQASIQLNDGSNLRGKIIRMDRQKVVIRTIPKPDMSRREIRKLKLSKEQRDSLYKYVSQPIVWKDIRYLNISRMGEKKRKAGVYTLNSIGTVAALTSSVAFAQPEGSRDKPLYMGSFLVFLGSFYASNALANTHLNMTKWKVIGEIPQEQE